jgi:adenosylcobinamide-phosphate synthase
MAMTAEVLLGACLLDAVMGDPRWLPHPVRLMGRVITSAEAFVRPGVRTPAAARLAGIALAIGLPALAYVVSWVGIYLAGEIHGTVGLLTEVLLAATTLATRDLADHALAVQRALESSLGAARVALMRIVGRDTDRLSEPEVVRAVVESVAESICDGVVAPLLYLSLGGAPLAMAYKAINTLDSMVGHRTSEYLHFGWASAKLDDAVNWVPARLTAGLLIMAGTIQAGTLRRLPDAVRILSRDGRKHPSPNSGHPEAAMAGVLQVRLGGTNVYHGVAERRPYLGDPVRPLQRTDIAAAVRLMWIAYLIGLGPAVALVIL